MLETTVVSVYAIVLLALTRSFRLPNEHLSETCTCTSFLQALKYRLVTDIVRPIRQIVRRREETTGHSVRPK